MSKKIVVLGTGGTIAGVSEDAGDLLAYRAAQLPVSQLMTALRTPQGVDLASEQLAQLDSKDMDLETWRRLALRCADLLAEPDIAAIVVTHGTDTLEETAWFLQALLAPARPIVLTGAMRPASASEPDGPRNLADALTVAAWPQARGVCVVFGGEIHDALAVTKAHTSRLQPFSSGEAGCLGRVAAHQVDRVQPWPSTRAPHALDALAALRAGAAWPRVEIVTSYAGAGAGMVQGLVRDGVDGIVVAGTGHATLHQDLEVALVNAQHAGVHVVRASRCGQGPLAETAHDRLPLAACTAPVKARVSLLLELLSQRAPAAPAP